MPGGNLGVLDKISKDLIRGDREAVSRGVRDALSSRVSASEILSKGLIKGMEVVGKKFQKNEFFLPEVLIAAKAMHEGLSHLKPILSKSGVKPLGRAVIGTVKGDVHDIGKNLVGMMLTGAGFEITDVGFDVSSEKFVQAIGDSRANLLCMSALLTTTMVEMPKTIELMSMRNLRGDCKVIIGGAPVTDRFAKMIGADGFSPDAPGAVNVAKKILGLASQTKKSGRGGSRKIAKR